MNLRIAILTLCAAVLVGACSAGAETLWSLGRADETGAEFALGGNYAEYPNQFPNDAVFTVGRSAPSAWPFIHPGPADAWAGAKTHTLRIEFELGSIPRHACRLTVCAVDTQGGFAPVMEARVNDTALRTAHWPAGAGDRSLTDPKAGRHPRESWIFPATALHAGGNAIALTVTEGSWLLYDAVVLESTNIQGVDVGAVRASSTPFFRKVDGVLKQAVRVVIDNAGLEGEAKAVIEGMPETAQKLRLKQGATAVHLLTPPFAAAAKHRVVVTAGGKTAGAEFEGRPERQWKLFVAPSTHTDIGYTDLQERIFERHRKNTTLALEACEKNPAFKWNLEVAAQADWLREAGANPFAVLERFITERRVGMTGLYLNMLTGICSGEELVQVLTPAQEFGRARNVPVHTAVLTDVPTAVGTLPMLLSQAGVTGFVDGINVDRGPVWFHSDKRMIQSPFIWEGLDGSRVMAIFTKSYAQAHTIGLRESVEAVEEKLPAWMQDFAGAAYPGDAIYVNGAFWDNESVNLHFVEVAEEWNKQWDFPQFIIARPDDFFQYVQDNFSQDLPVFHGDMGSYWEDGAASSALETGMARIARAGLSLSERWLALATLHGVLDSFPKDTLNEAWRNVLYYDEHTWGAAGSISQPEGEQTVKQWAYKAAYAQRGLEEAKAIAVLNARAVSGLAGAESAKHGATKWVLVQNALSWPRDLVVTVPAPGKLNAVRDLESGQSVRSQRRGDLIEFVAERVPAMGYRWYELGRAKPAQEAPLLRPGADAYTWETPRYRLRFDTKTGAIASLVDLKSGREWVDTASGYGINQFLYVTGGDGTSLIHPGAPAAPALEPRTHTRARVDLLVNSAIRAQLRVTREGDDVPPVVTDLMVTGDGNIELKNVVKKDAVLVKEAGYFAFPFKLDSAKNVRSFVELPYGIVEVDREQMPGACREWFAANTFVAAGDDVSCAYLATREAPMFTVGNLVRGLWPASVENNKGTLFAYVFNNYWHTNYKASQGGDLPFAFSLRLNESAFDPAAATRFGWDYGMAMGEACCPILTRHKPAGAPAGTFFTLSEGPVVLGDLGLDGERLVARLYNPSKQDAVAQMAVPGCIIDEGYRADLLGTQVEKLARQLPSDPVSVVVPARGIRTVSLEMEDEE